MKDLERYSRQVLFAGIGEAGQRKLLKSRVVIVGCGALGTVQASALARAGVGHIRVVDRDYIEENNLQRQILYDEEDIKARLPKAIAAQKRLQEVNSTIEIEGVVADVNDKNIEKIIRDADLVFDGVDNFETRFLLNDACIKNNIPWIYGACVGSYGITMSIIPKMTACVRCVFESIPPAGLTPTCDTAGVIASAVNIVASIQVSEGIKFLTGQREKMHGSLMVIDLWLNMFKSMSIPRYDAGGDCPTCARGEYEFLEAKHKKLSYATSLCGRNSVQVTRGESKKMSFKHLADKLNSVCEVSYNHFMLNFAVDGFEVSVFPDGRAIIKGTSDLAAARGIYSKYVGS